MNMILTHAEMHRYLQGAQYPMSKGSVIEYAEQNGASWYVLQLLDRLQDGQYFSFLDLAQEIAEESMWEDEEENSY